LNSNGYINGKKEKNSLGTNESISGIVFGNLDYDDSLEALAIHTWCSASCSRGVTAFKLIGENILMTELQGSNVSGAAEEIKSIKITANIAVVIKADAIGSEQTLNYRVSLVSGKLTSTKLTSSINTYFPKNDIQIYGVIDKTLNSPFGSNYFLVRSNNDIYKIFYDNNVTLYSNDCKGSLLMNLKGELNGVDIRQCTPDSNFLNKSLETAKKEWYGEVPMSETSSYFHGTFMGIETSDHIIKLEKIVNVVN